MMVLIHAVSVVIDATQRGDPSRRSSGWQEAGALIGRQALVPACAFAVTAFVWLPTIDAYLNSGADISRYSSRTLHGMAFLDYLSAITPRHLFRTYFPESMPTTSRSGGLVIWLGIAPLLVMVAGFPRRAGMARRLMILAVGLLVVAMAQHLAVPGLDVVGGLPLLRNIAGAYWMALAAGALTVGVAVAFETLATSRARFVPVLVAGSLMVVVFAIAVAVNWRPTRIALQSMVVVFAVVAAVVALTWVVRGDGRRRKVACALLLLVVAGELWSYQNHTRVERFDFEDDPPAYLAYLQQNGDGHRVMNAGRDALYPEWGAAFGIRDVGTLNVMQVPEYRTFFFRYVNPGEGTGKFLQTGGDLEVPFAADPVALDQLSVRHLVVADELVTFADQARQLYPLAFDDQEAGVHVFTNPTAFPRAYLSTALVPSVDVSGSPRWSTARAFTEDVQLLDAARTAGVDDAVSGSVPGTARIVAERNTRVEVEVRADAPSVLVLTDVFHENWSAVVNGEPAHLGRVNDVVRGVVVPAGLSVVEFEYRSRERAVGTVVSWLSLAALVVAAVVWEIVRRRRGPAPTAPEEVGPREPATVG
jgi:hypothetical protein